MSELREKEILANGKRTFHVCFLPAADIGQGRNDISGFQSSPSGLVQSCVVAGVPEERVQCKRTSESSRHRKLPDVLVHPS